MSRSNRILNSLSHLRMSRECRITSLSPPIFLLQGRYLLLYFAQLTVGHKDTAEGEYGKVLIKWGKILITAFVNEHIVFLLLCHTAIPFLSFISANKYNKSWSSEKRKFMGTSITIVHTNELVQTPIIRVCTKITRTDGWTGYELGRKLDINYFGL